MGHTIINMHKRKKKKSIIKYIFFIRKLNVVGKHWIFGRDPRHYKLRNVSNLYDTFKGACSWVCQISIKFDMN